jgi:hypothetical protein
LNTKLAHFKGNAAPEFTPERGLMEFCAARILNASNTEKQPLQSKKGKADE